MRIMTVLVTICCYLMPHPACRGDLIINVQDAQIAYGSSGFVDVTVSSTTSENLEAFGAQMMITTPANSNGGLEFDSAAFDASTVTSPFSYVFLSDSLAYTVTRTTATEINVGDATLSGSGVSLTGSYLLMRLLVRHTGGSGAVGDTFDLEFLHPAAGTSFLDHLGNTLSISGASDLLGEITIVTPEPAFGGFLAIGAAGFIVWRRRRSA